MNRPARSRSRDPEITGIRLDRWEDLHRYAKPGWLYRGHRKADWVIESSIERCFARENIPEKERYGLEQELLRDFQRAYHQYAAHVPGDRAVLEFMDRQPVQVPPDAPLEEVFRMLQGRPLGPILVVCEAGLKGMITLENFGELIEVSQSLKRGGQA